jgi:RNA polymerase sigma-70 factor (ECF subfamily)
MQKGQRDFARVYGEHVWRVYAFIAYRVGERELAEDLTQATFERALRAWSRFDPRRASESTWLLTIARNLVIDLHRRRGPYRLEPLEESELPPLEGPEQRLAGSPELLEALTKLPERERELLALRYGADLAGPEIAQLTGLSLANVHQILSRSLRRLRGLLDADQPPASSVVAAERS